MFRECFGSAGGGRSALSHGKRAMMSTASSSFIKSRLHTALLLLVAVAELHTPNFPPITNQDFIRIRLRLGYSAITS